MHEAVHLVDPICVPVPHIYRFTSLGTVSSKSNVTFTVLGQDLSCCRRSIWATEEQGQQGERFFFFFIEKWCQTHTVKFRLAILVAYALPTKG